MKIWFFYAALAVFFTGGCVSLSDGRKMKSEIDQMKAKMLELGVKLQEESKAAKSTGKQASLGIASTSTRVEKLTTDVQRIKGELDALKVGVKTGRLPGTADDPESLGNIIEDLKQRVAELEETQREVLKSLQKKSKSKSKKSANKLKSIKDFRMAFGKKQYRYIVDNAPSAIKRNKGNVKQELLYMEAESLYLLGKLRDAALKFDSFLKGAPPSNLKPKAQLRLGDSFRHLGDKDTALIYYQELVDSFPKSDEAKDAVKKIEKLGS